MLFFAMLLACTNLGELKSKHASKELQISVLAKERAFLAIECAEIANEYRVNVHNHDVYQNRADGVQATIDAGEGDDFTPTRLQVELEMVQVIGRNIENGHAAGIEVLDRWAGIEWVHRTLSHEADAICMELLDYGEPCELHDAKETKSLLQIQVDQNWPDCP